MASLSFGTFFELCNIVLRVLSKRSLDMISFVTTASASINLGLPISLLAILVPLILLWFAFSSSSLIWLRLCCKRFARS